MAEIIKFKRKEAKTVTVTFKKFATGAVIDVSLATLTFGMSKADDTTLIVTVNDASFDKSDGANGIATFPLSTSDLDRRGFYRGEIKLEISSANISKSKFIDMEIEEAITD